MSSPRANFDHIARPYRWLEYLTLGRALERCRLHFLPQLMHCRRALVLGDGDGRFLARLLTQNHSLKADAVDTSAVMLSLLRQRCLDVVRNTATRLRTHHFSALDYTPAKDCDLVVTHFFLDCLPQSEVDALVHRIHRIAAPLAPGTLWLVSDFCIPTGPIRLPAKLYVRGLYLAFRLLTGLRTTHLPDYAAPLTAAGFTRIAQHHSLVGILTTELWQLPRK